MLIYDIHDLTKIYPQQTKLASNHISLQIEQGEIFGLLGDNGAGKSTLIRQMVGLLRSTSGSIKLLGQDITHHPQTVALTIGYMPQNGRALNNLTVAEALYFTAHLRGLSRAEARKERELLLDLWQLQSLRNKPSLYLSGGQMRLMQIATAMAGSPPVLILDEPTANLDPQRRKLVWDILNRYNKEHGTTIIFITHDAIEAEKIIQRVGILHNGELVALGRPSDLKQRVDNQLRLELFFQPEHSPTLPSYLSYTQLEAGHWLVLLKRDQVSATLDSLRIEQIDDFRLYSTTLEDLYLHYAQHEVQHATQPT